MIVLLAAPIGTNSSLGNQLFQLSFGLYLEHCLGVKVRFFVRKQASTKPWSLSVTSDDQLIESLIPPSVQIKTRGITDSLVRLGTRLPRLCFDERSLENSQLFFPASIRPRILVSGYFQDFQYPEVVKKALLSRFDQSHHFKTQSSTCTQQIAIHVRLGDYYLDAKNRRIYGSISSSYYYDSVKLLIAETGIKNICVVSDDPSRAYPIVVAALKNIPELIVYRSEGSMLEDFRTLASSQAVVIGNSTFAWWAAWLGNARYKSQVVYPSPWYADSQLDASGLKNPNWTPVFRGSPDQT